MRYVENVMEVITDGITVVNLRRSDIQDVSTYDYTKYKHELYKWEETKEGEGLIHFGQSKKYDKNYKYPEMWNSFDSHWTYEDDGENKTGSDKECEMWERENGYEIETGEGDGNSSIKFKQSYYAHDYKGDKDDFVNEEYYNLLFNGEGTDSSMNWAYWLAGRYVLLYDDYCDFGINCVDTAGDFYRVFGYDLCSSNRSHEYSS